MYSSAIIKLSFLLTLFLPIHVEAALEEAPTPTCQTASVNSVKIVVLYPRSPAGSRHRAGIYDACKKFVEKHAEFSNRIYLEDFAYLSEEEGIDLLRSIFESSTATKTKVEQRKYHMIFGPIESGVFVKGLELLSGITDRGIPVVSPLVAAQEGNNPEGWFFRFNVDVETRAEQIYEYLNRSGFQNISVLFADRTLGQRSEAAFGKLLTDAQKKRYSTAVFSEEREEVRQSLVKIIENRPGAIGIFGQLADIKHIANTIKRMDTGWSHYTPALFTNIDAKELHMEDLHYVTMLDPKKQQDNGKVLVDDAYGIAYDTAITVFSLIHTNQLDGTSANPPSTLRSHLVNYMDGPPNFRSPGLYTGMAFDNFTNQAELLVVAMQDSDFNVLKEEPQAGFVWFSKCKNWLSILNRRYGYAPLWSVLLVLATGVIVNLIDLTKAYGVPLRYMKRKEFLQLIALNVSVAMGVFFFMTFSEMIKWNDTWGAIIAVFTYTMVLKSKIFASEKAQAIGFADFYNRIVKRKHDNIMLALLRKEGKTINYIAYTNTLVYLKKVLFEIFDFTEKENARELEEETENELEAVSGLVEKRKVLANKLHDILTWDELKEKRLVPYKIEEKDIEQKLYDPLVLVGIGAEYCISQGRDVENLEEIVRRDIHSIRNEEKAREKEENFDSELKNASTPQGVFETCLLWIYIQYGFRTRQLIKDGYLPANFKEIIIRPGVDEKPDQERRQCKRHVLDMQKKCNVIHMEAGAEKTSNTAELKNLSIGGAKLAMLDSSAKTLKNQMEIEVEMPQKKDNKPIEAEVVYIGKGVNANTIGVRWKKPLTEDDSLYSLISIST
jgi:hypothetical protein